MCKDINNCTCGPAPPPPPVDFSDLEDEAELKRAGVIRPAPGDEPPVTGEQHDIDQANRENYGGHHKSSTPTGYKCEGCNGTGTITIYRRGGGWNQRGEQKKCWKGCRGTGYTRTSPEVRRANRKRAAEKRAAKEQAIIDQADVFLDAQPNIGRWLSAGVHVGAEFHTSLKTSLFKYGSWTPGQLAAVRKSTARWLWKRRSKAVEKRAEQSTLDLTPIHSGAYAVPDGGTRLKIAIRRPGKRSKWHGWTFVDDGAEYGQRRNYGRQAPDGTYQGKVQDQLRAILADPIAAAAAYGELTGRCGVCGRPLEDEKSVARGIGPVCFAKLGG